MKINRNLLVFRPGGDKRDAQRLGAWMAERALVPEVVISSAGEPAATMVQKACKAAGLCKDDVRLDDRLEALGAGPMRDLVRNLPGAATRTLMAGASPGFCEALAGALGERSLARLAPGTLAHFVLEGSWTGPVNQWHLVEQDELPRDFPFPDANGTERRLRPAYYYRQSGVIPFRFTDDGIEVLMITTSSGNRWMIPKGIHDLGCTAQESAATEAFEEAGVLGEVIDLELGTYKKRKWGAICEIRVFPMLVSKEIPEEEREEQHRGRRWMSPADATALVGKPSLARMIGQLPAKLERAGIKSSES